MTKTAKTVIPKFLNKQKFSSNNTTSTGDKLILFGNVIAEWRNNRLWITTAGFSTKTTKDRLNTIPKVSVFVKNETLYLNNKIWDGDWIEVES